MKKNIILVVIIILLIPIVVLSFKFKTKSFLAQSKHIAKKEVKTKKIVKLKTENKIINLSLEEYIIGVVACEMPASFHIEALKAQAVASRTYALKKMENNNIYDLENSTNNQCYFSKEDMKQRWKSNFNKYYTKIQNATLNTKGEYLTYNGNIISAFYFAMSNGKTENSQYVFHENLPYINSVDSSWETTHKNFITEIILSEKNFLQKLNLKDKKVTKIEILNKTTSNRINELKINDTLFKGTDFRKYLNLKSTDFKIVKKDNNIKIKTKGYGHGVGMSQYGANGMANENKNYKEILFYYYKNVNLKKV